MVIDIAGRSEMAGMPVPECIVERGQLADVTVHQIVIGKFMIEPTIFQLKIYNLFDFICERREVA